MKIIINTNSIVDIPWKKSAIKTQLHDAGSLFIQHFLTVFNNSADEPPVGELLQKYHHLSGSWLVASPVKWHATHNSGLIVAVGKELQLTDEDARAIFNKLEHFFNEENRKIFWHDKFTWLIESHAEPTINALPPEVVVQKRIMPYLQQLDPTGYWVRKITETQMLLGSYPANGVWIWGQGRLHGFNKRPVYTNQNDLLKLLQLTANNASLLDYFKLNKHAIIVLDKISADEINQLLPFIKQYCIDWYCNNETFSTQPQSWWKKLIPW